MNNSEMKLKIVNLIDRCSKEILQVVNKHPNPYIVDLILLLIDLNYLISVENIEGLQKVSNLLNQINYQYTQSKQDK